jgi:transcriptional regulator with XRE-family HTH domain
LSKEKLIQGNGVAGAPTPGPSTAGSVASAAPPRLNVGREARRWRQARGLTLAAVGERSGLNIGYLSQIENDKAAPSLEALAAIAAAVDVPAAWLLLDGSAPPRVVLVADRPRADGPGGAIVAEVDAGTSRDVCILEVTVPVGGSTGVHAHQGDEHHLILAGRWRLAQGDHVVELGPGDYLAWDPTIPHDVENIGPDEGRMLVIYPRRGRERTPENTHRNAPDGR